MLRRIHGLLGIIPVGVFFLMHMFLNSRAAQSPEAYQWVPDTLDQIPFLPIIEIGGIILPILAHAVLGVVIMLKGDYGGPSGLRSKYGNIAYLWQRITGAILFVLILFHLWQTWWVHVMIKVDNAKTGGHSEFDIYGLMSGIMAQPFYLIMYTLFVLIAAYHFGNGIYNFSYKWGLTTSKQSQRFAIALGLLVGAVGVWWGFASIWGLRFAPWASY
jgi:succinate dehydrogenase / fumarate reductase cytochrome b subunit